MMEPTSRLMECPLPRGLLSPRLLRARALHKAAFCISVRSA